MDSLPTSRSIAVNLGQPRYFTGKVCKNGHIDQRNTSNGHCKGCDRMWEKTLVRTWKINNREHYNAIEKNRAVATRLKRRAQTIEALGGKCIRCGFDNEIALQFDHVKPLFRKTNNITHSGILKAEEFHAIINGTDHNIQLLCANCHAIKTKTEDVKQLH